MINLSKRTVIIILGVLFTIFIVLLLVALSTGRTTSDQPGPLAAILPPPIPTDIPLTSTPSSEEMASEAGSIADIPVGTPPDSRPGLPTATPIGAVPGLILTPADDPPDLSDVIVSEVEATPLPPDTVLQHQGTGPGSTPEFDLPPGMYLVSFSTDSPTGIVTPVVLEGDCSSYPLFIDFEGSVTYRSTGCRLRFEVEEVEGDWTIVVDPVTKGGVSSVPVDLSGDGPTTSNLIDLPAGDYHLDLQTDSPYSMVIPIVVDGPCLERPVILAENPGHYESTYRSMGCQIVFQISSVTDTWDLTITLDD